MLYIFLCAFSYFVDVCFFIFFFFFFQAEDGIRDVAVTGVQTCALPISLVPSGEAKEVELPQPDGTNAKATVALKELKERSEERRVGKECRYRWWRYE